MQFYAIFILLSFITKVCLPLDKRLIWNYRLMGIVYKRLMMKI